MISVRKKWLDRVNWLFVLMILAVVPIGNSFYQEYSLFYRTTASFVAVTIMLFIAISTTRGNAIWQVVKSARSEMRKVVWPTNKERNQATLVVIALSIVVAIFLSLLDLVFSKAVSWLLV